MTPELTREQLLARYLARVLSAAQAGDSGRVAVLLKDQAAMVRTRTLAAVIVLADAFDRHQQLQHTPASVVAAA